MTNNRTSASKNKFKISFVLPVYNTEDYVAETIDSIIAQDIGFEENCELVIVDDGSTDSSGEICKEYADKYPNNIKYIYKENGGVSSACNLAIQVASGRYIGFIGSDDKLSSDAARSVYKFFVRNEKKIDLVSIKLIWFDARSGDHALNYKFTKSRVINIEKEPESVQLSNGGVFIKSTVIKRNSFREDLKTHEDAELLTRVILDKKAYGVVAGPKYFYRRRYSADSLVGNSRNVGTTTIDAFTKIYRVMLDDCKKRYGLIPKYIQHLVMYDMQWKFTLPHKSLSLTEYNKIKKIFSSTLRDIDDDIIVDQRYIYPEHKIFALSLKYGRNIADDLSFKEDGRLYFNDIAIFNANRQKVRVEFIEVDDRGMTIEGWYGGFNTNESSVYVETNKATRYRLEKSYRPHSSVYSLGEKIYEKNSFKVTIPLAGVDELKFVFKIGNIKELAASVVYMKFSRLGSVPYSYRVTKNKLIIPRGELCIGVEDYTVPRHIKLELMLLLVMIRHGLLVHFLMRILYRLYLLKYRNKNIWLISDSPGRAGDNGEALFRFVSKNVQDESITPIFAIKKSSAYFNELKRYGRVVDMGGLHYKLLFLVSRNRISANFEEYINNPFGEDHKYYADLFRSKFVYLQHGVMAADLSMLINRNSKNIKLITSTSDREAKSIIDNPDYGYDRGVVSVTGQARFDLLTDRREKTLIIMPTWRFNLATPTNPVDMTRKYSASFKDSKYFKFYNRLINDKDIIEKATNMGYSIEFYVHPSHSEQWLDFTPNSHVSVMRPPNDVTGALSRGSLLVTDYSGVAFDFAYMRKPVIYTHFDKKTFYKDHTYNEGYYSFENDGFGEITYDYRSAVDAIIKSMDEGCIVPREYQDRADKFFYKIDNNNSKRVYDSIKNKFNRG